MRVVVDTNIFISSFFGGNPRKVIELWKQKKIILCLSSDILDEYVEVLQRMGLKDEKELNELLALFVKGFNILFTAKTSTIKAVVDDPDDNKFIECAVALDARFIITGDKALKDIAHYKGIEITIPNLFLQNIDKALN